MKGYQRFIRYVFLIFSVGFCSSFIGASERATDWTILVFIEGRNNLNNFAKRNISDMAAIGSNSRVNVLIEWFQPNEKTWRCRVDKNQIIPEQCVERGQDVDHVVEMKNAMRWAVEKYPAQHYGIILWNHGLGILDPVWNMGHAAWSLSNYMSQDIISFQEQEDVMQDCLVSAQADNPRTLIDGITTLPCQSASYSCSWPCQYRGILFNELDKTYMNNQDMVKAFSQIKSEILHGKKFGFIGFDACLMQMIEIVYQVKDYADFVVGSEEAEFAQGWDYKALLACFGTMSLDPMQVAQSIVLTYGHYYKNRTHMYTQSAVRLSRVEYIKENIDHVVRCLQECSKHNLEGIKKIICKARRDCQQFSTPLFIDLHSFYFELQKHLEQDSLDSLIPTMTLSSLKYALQDGMSLIEESVIANTAGPYLERSKGLAIYFPCSKIDLSYPKTEFAKNSLWFDFLKSLIG